MLCYLCNNVEDSLHLFPVVCSWSFSLVCESKYMDTYEYRRKAGMFFEACAYCVLSPLLGFRRCEKSKEDPHIILKRIPDFCDALDARVMDAEELVHDPDSIHVTVCLHWLCLGSWYHHPIFTSVS